MNQKIDLIRQKYFPYYGEIGLKDDFIMYLFLQGQ